MNTGALGGLARTASQLVALEDPLPAFNFFVTLDPTDAHLPLAHKLMIPFMALGAFCEVKGLSGELEVQAYAEGGKNDFMHQLPVRHNWGRITLRRGVIRDVALWLWYLGGLNGSLGCRRDGCITVCDESGMPAIMYMFQRAIATKWIGPDLNAMQPAAAIDGLEIAHEGLLVFPVPSPGEVQRAMSTVRGVF